MSKQAWAQTVFKVHGVFNPIQHRDYETGNCRRKATYGELEGILKSGKGPALSDDQRNDLLAEVTYFADTKGEAAYPKASRISKELKSYWNSVTIQFHDPSIVKTDDDLIADQMKRESFAHQPDPTVDAYKDTPSI